MLTTTPSALLLIKAFEGFEPQTYFDSAGIATIGFGTTKFANGDKPEIGDEITEDEAEAELFHHIRQEVEPIMNRHFEDVPLQPTQRDALASFLYNLGGNEKKWPTLKKLIRDQAPNDRIADQFMQYRKAGGKVLLGLHRRRIAEALVWKGMAWDKAVDLAQTASIDHDWSDFAPKTIAADDVDAEMFEDVKPITDPTPESPITTADANWMQLESLKHPDRPVVYADFDTSRAVTTQRNKIQTPKVDLKKPPKPMEDSKTHRGLAKRTSGRDDAWIGGVIAGASTMAGTASGISKDVSTITKNTQTVVGGATLHQIMIFGLIIGGALLLYGLWKMFRGETIAREGREEADVLKV